MNKHNRNRLTDTEDRPVFTTEEKGGRMGKIGKGGQEVQTSKYKIK